MAFGLARGQPVRLPCPDPDRGEAGGADSYYGLGLPRPHR
jgi:hypothetical protein